MSLFLACLTCSVLVASGGCDFSVHGLPLTSTDAPADLSVDPPDLSMQDDLATVVDLATDATTPPPDLTAPPDLAGCGLCMNGCAPCCNDVFTTGMTDTTSCDGTACTNCQESCGKNVGTCNLNCSTGATCHTVVDQSANAHGICTGGSTCQLTCSKVNGGCTIDCSGGSHCRLACSQTSCSFTTCSGGSGQMTCPNGDITCNQAC